MTLSMLRRGFEIGPKDPKFRLAYLAVAEGDGWVDLNSIAYWLGCSSVEARLVAEQMIEEGWFVTGPHGDTVAIDLLPQRGSDPSEARPANSGRHPSPALRAEVFARDGEICAYCRSTEGPFHLDHIHPWSRGGKTSADNLTVACAPCNTSKGSKTVDEWRATQ